MLIHTRRRSCVALGVVLLSLCAVSSVAWIAPKSDAVQQPRRKASMPAGDRDQWQMSARVMDEIGVRPGMTVADVGAGEGWFTFRLADRVGAAGRVIAEDIDAPAMNALREECAVQRAANISVLVGDPEDPKLPAGTVDVALMVNVLSALGSVNKAHFLGNLAKGLKPDGRLVIIEWDPVKGQQLTAQEFEPELAKELRSLKDAQFEVVKTLDFLPRQSMWICVRRTRE